MNSQTTKEFRKEYRLLPAEVQQAARQAYRLWLQDPYHNSLRCKQIHPSRPIFSVRIGLHWRAVGVKSGDTVVWYWIGAHSEYDHL